jgi:hypothetical protein
LNAKNGGGHVTKIPPSLPLRGAATLQAYNSSAF